MLKLRLKTSTQIPIELDGILPQTIFGKPLVEIERLQVFHGNQQVALAELFAVTGNADEAHIEFEGDLSGVHRLGAEMDGGEIRVAGNAGRHVGSEMKRGSIYVEGDASDWLGAQMQGGSIHVQGSAGNLAGGAYRGSVRGMTGGKILIDGNAGNEVGHSMRRGTIAVGKNCGEFVGVNMIAGTILVFGECGMRPAAGMRRGTVGLLGLKSPDLLPTFRGGCLYQPLFMQLLFRSLKKADFAVPQEAWQASYRIFHGDGIAGGRGEVLLRETS
jgi:formylmethanofuran dehydrogenase subunit C